jgi:hypothetical protein
MSNNTFNRFQSLLGKNSTEVVQITSVGSGTSQATTLSGQAVTVVGDSVTVGQKAFVRGNEIIRQAPNLTPTQVSI